MLARVRDAVGTVVPGVGGGLLRPTWRVLIAFVLTFAGIGGLLVAVTLLVDLGSLERTIVTHVGALVVAGVVFRFVAASVDRREVRNYGYRISTEWWLDFAGGAVLGLLVVAGVFAVGSALGWVEVVDLAPLESTSFLLWLSAFVLAWACVAVWEETLFRGVVLTNAAEGLYARRVSTIKAVLGAWLMSSLVFGLTHLLVVTVLANDPLAPIETIDAAPSIPTDTPSLPSLPEDLPSVPDELPEAPDVSEGIPLAVFSAIPEGGTLLGLVLAWTALGSLLGIAFVLTGELAFPIGIHFAFNLAVTNVFFGSPTPYGDGEIPSVLVVDVTATGLAHPFAGAPVLAAALLGHVGVIFWALYTAD